MSNHILPKSSNLLGLCFVILNFIKLSDIANETIIDEVSTISIVFFLISSVLSYLSIRSEERGALLEKSAEILFLVGLSLLAIISAVVALARDRTLRFFRPSLKLTRHQASSGSVGTLAAVTFSASESSSLV